MPTDAPKIDSTGPPNRFSLEQWTFLNRLFQARRIERPVETFFYNFNGYESALINFFLYELYLKKNHTFAKVVLCSSLRLLVTIRKVIVKLSGRSLT